MWPTFRLRSICLLLSLVSIGAKAADCETNFTSSGSFLTGQTYKTSAVLPSVGAEAAFQGAYRHIAKEGWRIERADQAAGVLLAINAKSSPGRPIPLNLTVEPANGGSKLSLSYSTPGGAMSPESAIKSGFCKIVDAAAAAPAPAATTTAVASTPAATGQPAATAGATGTPLCLAGACLGMTLEQAAALKLKPRQAPPAQNIMPTQQRAGMYGIDTTGKLVMINGVGGIDSAWIKQYKQTVKTLCTSYFPLSAQVAASDGEPVGMTFSMFMRDGKPVYLLSEIHRNFPMNMSASERKNLENQLRVKYGPSLMTSHEQGTMRRMNSGEPYAFMTDNDLMLKGPPPPDLHAALLEQPGCSNTATID